MALRLTEKEWATLSGKKKPEKKQVAIAGGYRSKWQGKMEVGGKECYFRSLWEYNFCCYLEWLKSNGNIKEWEFEPKLFKFPKDDYNAGPFQYLPDFRITENDGKQVWYEVKGWMNGKSKKKLKRFHKHFPEEGQIKVISKDWFSSNVNYKAMIPGWMSLKTALSLP